VGAHRARGGEYVSGMDGGDDVKLGQDDGLPPRKVAVNGVTLVAEELPAKGRGRKAADFWGPVIDKLLLLGEESMRVERAGKTGKTTYQSVARYLRTHNEKRVYAAQRGGACYLVRVPVKGARG
jgi:hypothetical protein